MKTPNALIVDDNPSDILIGKTILEKEGYLVHVANDGFAAIEQIQKHQMDVLIVDLNMPKMSGLEFLKTIQPKVNLKDIPVIVMSARNQTKDVHLAVRFGATDYIVKPVDLMIFQEKIAKIKSKMNQEWHQYALTKPVDVYAHSMMPGTLTSISEVGFELMTKTPYSNGDAVDFDFSTDEIDLGTVYARVSKCEPTDGVFFRVKMSFIGLRDQDRKKIRLFCNTLKGA